MAVSSTFPGIGPVVGYSIADPYATPEERYGSPVNPDHAKWGEQAAPYSWQSQVTNYPGHTGPYGSENALLGDKEALGGMPAGTIGKSPTADLTPYRTHAAPMTRTLSGPLPSQYEAINDQLVQADEIRATDLGGSRKATLSEQGWPQQDHWSEVWNVEGSQEKYPPGTNVTGYAGFGFGNNDRTVNPMRKINQYGYGLGHRHRRYATGSIPGNYMWMRPAGRAMFKSLAGPARPAVGSNSPFQDDDLGLSFGIQGAVLVEVPTEYQPPPMPQLAAPINYDEPAPAVDLW